MTLLEVMVVITLIGIVSAITAVSVMKVLENARVDTTRQSIVACEEALKLYSLRRGGFPDTAAGLEALLEANVIDAVPRDGWGNALVYLVEGRGYRILSYGRDGMPGGDGFDADLTNLDLR